MNNKLKSVSVFLFLVLSEIFFFRNVIFCDSLIGDLADGRLTTMIAEHWWNFFNGTEGFLEVPIFYPEKNVIAYTELLLSFGVIHSIFRFLSFDMFASYKYTLIFIHAIGTFSTYYLCRRKLNMSIIWSLFATSAFSFSHCYALHSAQTQLYGVSLLPLITIFVIEAIDRIIKKEKYNLPAYIAVFFFVILMYASWYVSYFCFLFCFVSAVIYIIALVACRLSIMPFISRFFEVLPNAIGYLLFSIVLLFPLLTVYIAHITDTNGYSYDEAIFHMPSFIDLINVGDTNWLLGNIMHLLNLGTVLYHREWVIGFSFVLLVMFFVTMIGTFYETRDVITDKNAPIAEKYQLVLISCLFLSIIICTILPLRFTQDGRSLWWVVYNFLGGNSIRAISRFIFWLNFPMALITAYAADKFFDLPTKKLINIPVVLLALLIISNIREEGVFSYWNSEKELKFIERVSPPPAEMEAFFIVNDDYPYSTFDVYSFMKNIYENMDAYVIATAHHLKTINGYSGGVPEHWLLDRKGNYLSAVEAWVGINHISNVYAYDAVNNEWLTYNEFMEKAGYQ